MQNFVTIETSSYFALTLWGICHTVIAGSLLIALLAQLADLSVWAKLGIGVVMAGCFARAYGYWTGVKEPVNVWDLMVCGGLAGMVMRLALRGVRGMNLDKKEDPVNAAIYGTTKQL